MDHENFDDIQLLKQKALKQYKPHHVRATVALMSEHDPVYFGQALPDPYYGGADGFERVLDQCESSAQAWVQIFKQQALNSKS